MAIGHVLTTQREVLDMKTARYVLVGFTGRSNTMTPMTTHAEKPGEYFEPYMEFTLASDHLELINELFLTYCKMFPKHPLGILDTHTGTIRMNFTRNDVSTTHLEIGS